MSLQISDERRQEIQKSHKKYGGVVGRAAKALRVHWMTVKHAWQNGGLEIILNQRGGYRRNGIVKYPLNEAQIMTALNLYKETDGNARAAERKAGFCKSWTIGEIWKEHGLIPTGGKGVILPEMIIEVLQTGTQCGWDKKRLAKATEYEPWQINRILKYVGADRIHENRSDAEGIESLVY
ncbi:hypothetical protein HYX10_01390 [Candidatus Woesearchaeota archaeon]|nr:hypothetical protein [Candidatus Woesearchaeota archaeon]